MRVEAFGCDTVGFCIASVLCILGARSLLDINCSVGWFAAGKWPIAVVLSGLELKDASKESYSFSDWTRSVAHSVTPSNSINGDKKLALEALLCHLLCDPGARGYA